MIQQSKEAVEAQAATLKPDDDILPTLYYRDREDRRCVMGIETPDDDATKDQFAALMMASMVVDEAVEAVYSTFVWMVDQRGLTRDETETLQRDGWRGPMPKDHPDRVEQALIAHYTPDGAQLYFATVTRTPDAAPVLGPWRQDTFTKLGGRISRALEGGLKMSATLPEELRVAFRAAKTAEFRDAAIRGVMRAMLGDIDDE